MSLPFLPKDFSQLHTILLEMNRRIDNIEGLKGASSLKHSKLSDIEDHQNFVKIDGSRKFTGVLDMGGHTIKNGRNPLLNADVRNGDIRLSPKRQLMLSPELAETIDPLNQGFLAPTELTISGGEIVVSNANKFLHHTVDTEGNAASDELTAITGGAVGALLVLTGENAGRKTTVVQNSSLKIQFDFILSPYDTLTMMCVSSGTWKEIARASNG